MDTLVRHVGPVERRAGGSLCSDGSALSPPGVAPRDAMLRCDGPSDALFGAFGMTKRLRPDDGRLD